MGEEKGHLVITRTKGEAFYIGSDIKIKVVQSGKKVRLLISAPRSVSIMREELVVEWESR